MNPLVWWAILNLSLIAANDSSETDLPSWTIGVFIGSLAAFVLAGIATWFEVRRLGKC